MNFTDEANTHCEKKVVFWVDVHDDRKLAVEHVSTDETLGECGCSKSECKDIEDYINKYRLAEGKPALASGTITPKTTIKELVSYAC